MRITCYTWLQQKLPPQPSTEFDEELFDPDPHTPNPEQALIKNDSAKLLRQALETLPANSREVDSAKT